MQLRLLVVEDSQPLASRIVSAVQEIEGVSVSAVVGGEREARRAIDRLTPDAILLDLRLHDGSGFGVLAHAAAAAKPPTLIVLSNYSDAVSQRRALEMGADWFFDKSADFEAMVDCLTDLARIHGGRGEGAEPHPRDTPDGRERELLRFAGQIARFGGWYADVASGEVYWSDEVFEIHDLLERREITVDEAISFYHPDDRPRVEAMYRACVERGIPWNAELRMITATGRQIWVHTLGRAVPDEAGRVVRVQGAFQDITRRREAEERAGRLERTLSDTLERMSDAFFTVDAEWRFTWVNAAAARIFRRSPEELLGRDCWEAFPGTRELELGRESERAMEMDRSHEFTTLLPARGMWVSVRTFPMATGMAVYFRDVTEARQQHERLAEQAVLIEEAGDAIVAWGDDRRISLWNRGAERALGWTAEEALGADLSELLSLDEDVVAGALATVRREGEWAGELEALDRAGMETLLDARWSRVEGSDVHSRTLGIHTDVTGRRQIERRTLRAQRLESLGTLTGGIAHDLNNILTPILMAIEPLRPAVPSGRQEQLDTIETCALRGSAMVKRLLGFARGTDVERADLCPRVVVEEVVELVRGTLPGSVAIHTDIHPDLWAIRADPTQVHQVLMNLCVNARDAMPEGGSLIVGARNEDFTAGTGPEGPVEGAPGRYVAFSVTDTGTGIDDYTLSRIFDPFFTTKENGAGTGLGLSTADAIARGHGGFVRAYSEPGEGSRFTLYLPVTAPRESRDVGPLELPAAREPAPGEGRLVLVVDDEALIRAGVRRTLEAGGYGVLEASDGAEAIEAFETHGQRVSAVVTDLMMPRMDGVAAARSLLERVPGLPMVVTTGFEDSRRRREIEKLGVCEVLTKPYPGPDLLRAIDRSLAAAPAALRPGRAAGA